MSTTTDNKELKSDNLKINVLLRKHDIKPQELKFGEAKTKAGELVMWDGDAPATGQAIGIEDAPGSGNFNPANGKYELEDGTIIEAVDGLISTVTPAEQTPADPPAQPNNPPAQPMEQGKEGFTPEQTQAVKRTVESIVKETVFTKTEVDEMLKPLNEKIEKFSAVETEYKTKFSAQEETIKTNNGKIETLSKQVGELIVLLQKTPATPAAATPTSTPFAMSANVNEEQQARVGAILNQLKKS